MTWKSSRYTRAIAVDDGAGLLYNGRTGALVQLGAGTFDRAKALLGERGRPLPADCEADALFTHLRLGEFIVAEDYDELRTLEELYEGQRRRSRFQLTIFPTFGCNLACDYCFVGRKRGALSRVAQDEILAFVRRHLEENEIPGMSVDWLGGEPLLALPVIEYLSRGFRELCAEKGIPYSAQVITNGTVITDEAIGILETCGVDRLQITLDGPQEIHDRRRPFKVLNDARSSFEVILSGLERLLGKFLIRLRINVDRHNLDNVWPLLELFEERGWLGPEREFYPYLSRVAPFTEACSSVVDDACDLDSFYRVQFRWIERLFELGVPVLFQGLYQYPLPRHYNCGAIGTNGFIFNAAGEVHKCGLAVDDPGEAVGTIGQQIDVDGKASKWRSFSPFDNPKCRRCPYLPSCLGGCPRDQLENRTLQKRETCVYYKKFEDQLLALHVRLQARRASRREAPAGALNPPVL